MSSRVCRVLRVWCTELSLRSNLAEVVRCLEVAKSLGDTTSQPVRVAEKVRTRLEDEKTVIDQLAKLLEYALRVRNAAS